MPADQEELRNYEIGYLSQMYAKIDLTLQMLIQLKSDFSIAMSLLEQSKIILISLNKFGKEKMGIM